MSKFKNILFSLAVLLLISACSDDDDSNSTNSTSNRGRVDFRLTDEPGDYKNVFVDIQAIRVNYSNEEDSGWNDLDSIKTGIYDLLTLQNGLDTLLGYIEFEDNSRLQQIRLILGDRNSIVLNSEGEEEIQLSTPSAQQSGLKINVNEVLDADKDYQVLLDFDADKSIVETGNGKYNLKPTINAEITTK